MSPPSYAKSLASLTKRLKLSPSIPVSSSSLFRCLHQSARKCDGLTRSVATNGQSDLTPIESLSPAQLDKELQSIRLPRAVQATYLTPLRRKAEHEDAVCDLQLRSYSVRNLEVFADFAMRAAYYLNMPAKGPIPLPRITERWTVPRSNFVHKKSQENFERITLRRLIQIQDANPVTVSLWLSFLQKHRYYGIGMKANVFDHGSLDEFDRLQPRRTRRARVVSRLLREAPSKRPRPKIQNTLGKEIFKGAFGGYSAPMASAQSTPSANRRSRGRRVLTAKPIEKQTSVASGKQRRAESGKGDEK